MKTKKQNEQLTRIIVPKGKFCGDCPYYQERGPTCIKLRDQVPFHLSKHCINFGGYKYTECPIYRR